MRTPCLRGTARTSWATFLALGALAASHLVACGKHESTRAAPVTSTSAPSSAPALAAPAPSPPPEAPAGLTPPDFGPPGEIVLSPKLPPLEKGMMDHVDLSGWSKDGADFVYCQTNGGSGGRQCVLTPPVAGGQSGTGRSITLSDFDGAKGSPDPKLSQAQKDKTAALGVPATPGVFRFAKDLELTWRVNDPVPDKKEATLEVGAHVAGEAPSWAVTLTASGGGSKGMASIHPEAVALSPDGEHLAVVGHSFAGEFSDTFSLGVATARDVASRAYNDAGFAHHKRKDYAKAVELFTKATFADLGNKVAPYNLACACALAKSPCAEPALREAVKRGGDAVKTRAKRDRDLAGVAAEPWFTAVTGS